MRKNINDDVAKDLEDKYPLSKSASIEKKFDWASSVSKYLEENLSQQEIIDVRKDCRCNDGRSNANKLTKYLNQTTSILDFVNTFNENETFAHLEYICLVMIHSFLSLHLTVIFLLYAL